MLLGTLGDILTGWGINRAGEGIVIAVMEIKDKIMKTKWIFNALHAFNNFKMQKYYQNEPRFNGVYSRDNLPRIKDEAYMINHDEYSDTGTR